MSMDHPERRRIEVALAQRSGRDAGSAATAAAVTAVWKDIATALTPIVGRGGVAALYARCLHLARDTHPWLEPIALATAGAMDLDVLEVQLSKRSAEAARTAGLDLLLTFHSLLTTLVGASLTERLLASVWNSPSSGGPAQDTSA